MSSTWNRMKGMLGIALPMSVGVLALSAGTAHAQLTLEGSDTLTVVVQQAITNSGANLTYVNTGSGQGEKNIAQAGCPAAGITGAHFQQGIAPMSRNLQQAILTSCPTWAPTSDQVVGLDAAVMGSRSFTGRCMDLTIPHLASDVTTADNTQQSDLSMIFYGYDPAGTSALHGTTTQCSHPNRIAALNRLTSCMGVNQISHIYRRDDSSGTQDTIREHLAVNYWCNGKSEGNFGAAGSNMLNEDLDPIRRPCVGADATHAASRCSYYPTAKTCSFGDPDITVSGYGTVKCTQGLIVALSENDPGSADITVSIANRIKNDTFNQTMGMAGRAMVELSGQPTSGLTVNTVTFTDTNVRANQYMFSRRLFIEHNPSGSGNSARDTEEAKLFTYMTNKCNLDPIVRGAGFLSCFDDCTTPCLDPNNLCCLPALAGVGNKKQNIGAESVTVSGTTYSDLGDATHPCVSAANTTVSSSGVACPVITVEASGYACNLGGKCTSSSCTLDSSNIGGVCQ
jgi:hypothetical protein